MVVHVYQEKMTPLVNLMCRLHAHRSSTKRCDPGKTCDKR